jgi:hypothetical protein
MHSAPALPPPLASGVPFVLEAPPPSLPGEEVTDSGCWWWLLRVGVDPTAAILESGSSSRESAVAASSALRLRLLELLCE